MPTMCELMRYEPLLLLLFFHHPPPPTLQEEGLEDRRRERRAKGDSNQGQTHAGQDSLFLFMVVWTLVVCMRS